MPTLKYLNESFECTTAIKGNNYIHLLDANGTMVAAFDEITDFSGFTLENGSYTSPTEDHDCYLAVIRDDGTIGKGTHTCADVGSGSDNESDPFLWRTVDIVPLADIDNYQSVAAGTTKKITLPVPIDLSKYQYQIDIEVLGLQEYNNTNTKETNAAWFYMVNQVGTTAGDAFISIENTCDETERSRHLFWPHKIDCKLLTDAKNNFFYTKKGMAYGEPLDTEGLNKVEYTGAVYPVVAVEFSESYPVETYGILLHYRAYKAK